ncbi:MAG: leucine-rich repeat protein [Clostridiales bacterium]|nr:leucine-rich repeat protein [Clostridiales bacterium]
MNKIRKISLVVILLLTCIIPPLYAANNFDTGTVTVDSQWDVTGGKTLEDEITFLCGGNLTSVTALNVSAGELTDTDVMWITENLSEMITLNITGDATFTSETIDGEEVMLLPERAFSGISGRDVENGEMNQLVDVIIDIDDTAIIHLNKENFSYCDELKTINIVEARKIVGIACMYQNSKLTDITLENLTLMEYPTNSLGAFENSHALVSVSLPKVIKVGHSAFGDCGLLETVNLPEATTFSSMVFSRCGSLTSVTFEKAETFESDAFFSCLNLTSVSLPKTISMGNESFESCKKLVTVDMPLVTSFGERVFLDCEALESISLPELTTLGAGGFNNCKKLKTVELKKLVSVGNFVFQGCLLDITLKLNNTPPTLVNFTNTPKFINYIKNGISPEIIAEDTTAYKSADDGDTGDELWYGWTVRQPIINNAPTVANAISDMDSATVGVEFSLDLANVFTDPDAGDSLVYSTDKGSITGSVLNYTPVVEDVVGTAITITVTAKDTSDASVTDEFVINSVVANPTPINLSEVSASGDYFKIAIGSIQDAMGTLYVLTVLDTDNTVIDADYIVANGTPYGRIANEYRTGNLHRSAGTYKVYFVVQDLAGQRSEVTVISDVVIPELLTITTTQENVSSFGGSDGKIIITASGNLVYEYTLGSTWQDSNVFENLSAGSYHVKAREKADTENHSLNSNITITQPNRSIQEDKVTESTENSNTRAITVKEKTALEKALEKVKDGDDFVTELSVQVTADKKGEAALAIPKGFVGKKVDLKVETKEINIVLKGDMFTGKEKDVKLVIKPKDKEELGLSEENKALIGDLPIFDISITIENKKVNWSSDENIEIDFPLKSNGRKNHKFVAVYINEDGEVEVLRESLFNGNSIVFSTKHLSHYSVMYIDKTFDDSTDHWANEAIEALASRSITSGTSESTFSPDKTLTRAEFVTLITTYFNIKSDQSISYSDVDASKYYALPVAAAKENGLLPVIYGEKFKPDEAITREDVMYILYKTLLITGNDVSLENKDLDITLFTDKYDLSYYAVEGAGFLVSRDIIHGYNNMLTPNMTTTRAEVAQILYSLIQKLSQ